MKRKIPHVCTDDRSKSHEGFENNYLSNIINMFKKYHLYILKTLNMIKQPAISYWIEFDWNKIETRPTECKKYLICRKDGKIHWETWNGSGWAYNHNEIRYYASIIPPTI